MDAQDPVDFAGGEPECEDDTGCENGSTCIEGSCKIERVYGDCNTSADACGLVDSDCLGVPEGGAYGFGLGVCTWQCSSDADCPPGPSGSAVVPFCFAEVGSDLSGNPVDACTLDCSDAECPTGMGCYADAFCMFASDGCGPTAHPSGDDQCLCDAGLVWCDYGKSLDCCPDDANDANDDNAGDGGGGGCCKTCTNSKPCGDSCISYDKTCNVGAGCAC